MSEISRRCFLQAGVAAMTFPSLGCADANRKPLGIQLYTLREEMSESVPSTFSKLAQIGYEEVEFAGYFDYDAEALRRLLDEHGLTAPACHIPLPLMQSELEKTLEFASAMGHRYVVIPSLGEEQRQSIDQYRRTAETFNRLGEQCKAAGLQLAYHNHAFEFDVIDGQVPYDVLLDETDPELVGMEMDIYWVRKAGQSPVRYLTEWPDRFPLWHLKDMLSDGSMVDVGDGEIDFPALLEYRDKAGLRHGFVEHDHPADALQSAERSFEFLVDKW
jgi:sugar phosphate isomerase/epimerase